MDSGCEGWRDELVADAVTVFSRDTVLKALALMRRYERQRLPVVDTLRGDLLGEVTRPQLESAWELNPLGRLEDVLAMELLSEASVAF